MYGFLWVFKEIIRFILSSWQRCLQKIDAVNIVRKKESTRFSANLFCLWLWILISRRKRLRHQEWVPLNRSGKTIGGHTAEWKAKRTDRTGEPIQTTVAAGAVTAPLIPHDKSTPSRARSTRRYAPILTCPSAFNLLVPPLKRTKWGRTIKKQFSDFRETRWVGVGMSHLPLWWCSGVIFVDLTSLSQCPKWWGGVGRLACHFTSSHPALPGSLYLHLCRETFACTHAKWRQRGREGGGGAVGEARVLERTPVNRIAISYAEHFNI